MLQVRTGTYPYEYDMQAVRMMSSTTDRRASTELVEINPVTCGSLLLCRKNSTRERRCPTLSTLADNIDCYSESISFVARRDWWCSRRGRTNAKAFIGPRVCHTSLCHPYRFRDGEHIFYPVVLTFLLEDFLQKFGFARVFPVYF